MIPGIKGWLLVYCLGPLGIGSLMLMAAMQYDSGMGYLLLVNLVLLYITINNRTPMTRTINIWANGLFAGLIFVSALSANVMEMFFQAIGASIWFFYWINSDRVKITYGVAA